MPPIHHSRTSTKTSTANSTGANHLEAYLFILNIYPIDIVFIGVLVQKIKTIDDKNLLFNVFFIIFFEASRTK